MEKIVEQDIDITEKEERMILDQIKYLHDELLEIQKEFLGAISLPLGIYALVIYYALQSHYREIIFSILPFLFSLSLFNILKYSIKMLGIDAYIRHLEGILNVSHKKNLFMWQTYLVYTNWYSAIGGICQIPAFLALSIYIGVMFTKSVHSLGTIGSKLPMIFKVLLAIEVLMLLITIVGCLTQYQAVLYWCKKIDFKITEDNEDKLSKLDTSQLFILQKEKK